MATQLPEVGQWTSILLSSGRHHKHLMNKEMDEGESLSLSLSLSLSCFKNWFYLLRALPQHSISLSVRVSVSEQSCTLSVGLSEEPNELQEAGCSLVEQIMRFAWRRSIYLIAFDSQDFDYAMKGILQICFAICCASPIKKKKGRKWDVQKNVLDVMLPLLALSVCSERHHGFANGAWK
jgi:hypothetical protein